MPEPTPETTPVVETPAVETPKPDVFGNTLNPDGSEVSPEVVVKKEDETKKVEEETKAKAEEIEKSPVVVELKGKLDEYSKNLKGQNDVISKLEKTIEDLSKGKIDPDKKPEEGEVLFKDIKTSKDLTTEQKEDMTDTEIALYDRNAQLETAMNGLFTAIKEQGKTTETAKVEDLNSSAKMEASKLAEEAIKANPELAKDTQELVNKIIVEFNEFNNEGISPEKLAQRVKKALNNVEGYKAPKEQKAPDGSGKNAVKDKNGVKDTSKIDNIVKNVNVNNTGEYNL